MENKCPNCEREIIKNGTVKFDGKLVIHLTANVDLKVHRGTDILMDCGGNHVHRNDEQTY